MTRQSSLLTTPAVWFFFFFFFFFSLAQGEFFLLLDEAKTQNRLCQSELTIPLMDEILFEIRDEEFIQESMTNMRDKDESGRKTMIQGL